MMALALQAKLYSPCCICLRANLVQLLGWHLCCVLGHRMLFAYSGFGALQVGISAVCVLGYNVNRGQEISLRLRTDDYQGLRKYGRIRETLVHELAHMVSQLSCLVTWAMGGPQWELEVMLLRLQ
jgi:hypothetical protein